MKKLVLSIVVMMLTMLSVFAQNFILLDSAAHALPSDTRLIKSVPVFSDRSNANDTESVNSTTFLSGSGISDAINVKNSISASPNPANEEVTFTYTLIPGSSGKIIILQITGTVISENPVQGTHGNFVLDTREIKAGLYFYYLMADGKVCSAKKFVVRHS
jgi:hypothetical protein